MAIQVDIDGNEATGTMTMQGNSKPIEVDLEVRSRRCSKLMLHHGFAPPRQEGYTTTFRNFDLLKQKAKLMQLKVAGMEALLFPRVRSDSYKLDVTS